MAKVSEPKQIDQILQACNARILGYLIRICGNFQDAEDICQDVMLTALTHWNENNLPDNPLAWLFTTAKNRATDHFRQQAKSKGDGEPSCNCITGPLNPGKYDKSIDQTKKGLCQ